MEQPAGLSTAKPGWIVSRSRRMSFFLSIMIRDLYSPIAIRWRMPRRCLRSSPDVFLQVWATIQGHERGRLDRLRYCLHLPRPEIVKTAKDVLKQGRATPAGGAFRFQILRDSCKSRGKRVLVATVFLAFQRFQAVASPLFLNDSDTLGGTEKHDFFRVEMILQFAQIRRNMPQVVMS